jgi:hypothetical protein
MKAASRYSPYDDSHCRHLSCNDRWSIATAMDRKAEYENKKEIFYKLGAILQLSLQLLQLQFLVANSTSKRLQLFRP